jgi:hypothetical protein
MSTARTEDKMNGDPKDRARYGYALRQARKKIRHLEEMLQTTRPRAEATASPNGESREIETNDRKPVVR